MVDLLVMAEIEHRKELLDQLFQESIGRVADKDPSYHFWYRSLRITHGLGIDSHDVFVAIDQYADELTDWLALNYPTKHWKPTGIYTRIDHILSVH